MHQIVTETPGSFLGEKSQNVDKVSVVDSKSIRKYEKSRMFMPTDKIVLVQKIWAETPRFGKWQVMRNSAECQKRKGQSIKKGKK